MTVDFQNVANRLPEFGNALKAKLAVLASVPENALRLNGLRSGSIIADFLVLPTIVPHYQYHDYINPRDIIERLHDAIEHDPTGKNAAELCALTGGPLESCYVELKDLGFAMPSVKPFVPEQRTQQQQEKTDTQAHGNVNNVIYGSSDAWFTAMAAVLLLLCAMYVCVARRSSKAENGAQNISVGTDADGRPTCETKVTASMEEGESLDDKKSVEEDDNNSTICPSNSDKQSDLQSEPSLCEDV
jgi:hypothetical protein